MKLKRLKARDLTKTPFGDVRPVHADGTALSKQELAAAVRVAESQSDHTWAAASARKTQEPA